MIAASLTVLAIGLAACGSDDAKDSEKSTSAAATTSVAAAAATPTAADLQATLDLVADATKGTPEKVAVIVNGPARTANIDQMNGALAAYGKLKFNVTDVVVQGDNANANVTIESPSAPGQPSPPMPLTWQKADGVWKLTDATACTLLGFAQAPCVP